METSLPFCGKTSVISRDFSPPRPILPLCCFIFQAVLGIPGTGTKFFERSFTSYKSLPILMDKFKSSILMPMPATSVQTSTWQSLERILD